MNKVTRMALSIGAVTLLIVVSVAIWMYMNSSTEEIQAVEQESLITVTSVEVEDLTESSSGRVYATLSNGERRLIAQSDGLDSEKEYYYQVTYREAFISPNGLFVAVQGMGFEDPLVRVYEVASDVLYEETYGEVVEWTDGNLLNVRSCDLSGERCTNWVSTSPQTPWVFEEGVGVSGE